MTRNNRLHQQQMCRSRMIVLSPLLPVLLLLPLAPLPSCEARTLWDDEEGHCRSCDPIYLGICWSVHNLGTEFNFVSCEIFYCTSGGCCWGWRDENMGLNINLLGGWLLNTTHQNWPWTKVKPFLLFRECKGLRKGEFSIFRSSVLLVIVVAQSNWRQGDFHKSHPEGSIGGLGGGDLDNCDVGWKKRRPEFEGVCQVWKDRISKCQLLLSKGGWRRFLG